MTTDGRLGVPRIVAGSVIILVGALMLLARFIEIDLGKLWPFFVILPGVVILAGGLAARPGGGGTAATVIGSQLTGAGLLLLFQNSTGLWQTWAYAWALVWPASIGLGLMMRGTLMGEPATVRSGGKAALVGLGLFAAGVVFFEGILNISGTSFGRVGDFAVPAILIAAGLVVMLRRR